jgi:predicted HicB family RNase H-like nuclease
MPRKSPRGAEMPVKLVSEPKLKPVRLDLAEDVHRLLRLVAADEGVSMAAYARDAFERHLREEAAKRGIKSSAGRR